MAKQPAPKRKAHVEPHPFDRSPPSQVDKVDVTKLTEHQRIARLEGLVELIAEHQVTLGQGLLSVHQRISEMRLDQMSELPEGDGLVGFQPAPIIMPGPHPLRPKE